MSPSTIINKRDRNPVIQFSIFADNKVGRLNDLIQALDYADIHIMALSQVDSTECTIIRLIVDYPEEAAKALKENTYSFSQTEMLAVEIVTEAQIKYVTAGLVEAEINIHYLYPFLMRPNNRSALALNVEDIDLASEVLKTKNLKLIDQNDIGR